jgi:hypothetical protein
MADNEESGIAASVVKGSDLMKNAESTIVQTTVEMTN